MPFITSAIIIALNTSPVPPIFTGILSTEKNSRYDTLVNIATIQGKTNILFRQKMKETLASFGDALDLIKELETIDLSYGNRT